MFSVLLQHQLYVKLSKCDFRAMHINYLGHVIRNKGSLWMQRRLHVLGSGQSQKTIKELRGFFGLTSYYRRFVKGYEIIAQPLTNLLKKEEFQWHDKAQQAFKELKHALVTTPILALPDFNSTFVIESDASSLGIGAVLSQGGRPISYFSKALFPKH